MALCRSRLELTRALAEIRRAQGIPQIELDELAGFCSGYTGKLEQPFSPGKDGKRPSGRSAFPAMFDLWIGALGVALIVVPDGMRFYPAHKRPMKTDPQRPASAQLAFELWPDVSRRAAA